MNALIYATLGVIAATAFALWGYALYDLFRCDIFVDVNRALWLWIILLFPVGGPIAYLSAKKNVQKYSPPDPTRLPRLTAKEPHA